MTSRAVLVALLGFAGFAVGCTDDQDPDAAAELWERVHTEQYRTWARAPGYETRVDSDAPHGGAVEIFVNPTIEETLAGEAQSAWPVGSLIVKDGYDGDDLELVAIMEKRSDGWFWAEYDAEGDPSYSGSPDLCTSCHSAGQDFVRAFGLPQ